MRLNSTELCINVRSKVDVAASVVKKNLIITKKEVVETILIKLLATAVEEILLYLPRNILEHTIKIKANVLICI